MKRYFYSIESKLIAKNRPIERDGISSIFMLVLFTLAVSSFLSEVTTVTSHPEVLVVDDDGGADFTTIQEAINNATSGDVVFVRSGIYHEKIVVDKSNLTVIGEGNQLTIIDGGGDGPVVRISADDVVFTGFTVRQGGDRPGVEILKKANFISNRVLQSKIGVFVSFECVVADNYIADCGNGVSLYSCFNATVKANNFSGNTVGISLSSSYYNLIANNTITQSIPGGHGITVLSNSYGNTIEGNLLWNNSHGMWLSSSSHENLIVGNTIAKNSILGIELTDAPNNTIYHNNFIDNKKQVTTNTVNRWNSSYPIGGNFWSNYRSKYSSSKDNYSGEKQDIEGSDGIWDHPYIINSENIDHYPLAKPFGEIPDSIPPVTADDYIEKWYNKDFIINLNASDNLSGVQEIFYRINNGSILSVYGNGYPLISNEGSNNTLEYWAVDWMNNEEPHHFLMEIKLDKTKPTVSFETDKVVKVGENVIFNATGCKDDLSGIVSYEWNLGDGTKKSGVIVSHNYTETGSFNVTLTVTDAAGNTNSTKITVEVVEPPDFLEIIIPVSALAISSVVALTLFRKVKKRKKRRGKLKKS
jgi:parallel beta-helix repeat protein